MNYLAIIFVCSIPAGMTGDEAGRQHCIETRYEEVSVHETLTSCQSNVAALWPRVHGLIAAGTWKENLYYEFGCVSTTDA